jgi:hypothetical protein
LWQEQVPEKQLVIGSMNVILFPPVAICTYYIKSLPI